MIEVEWKHPVNMPKIPRGKDIKVWGLVDIYQYRFEWGGLAENGKAERKAILEKVTRRVVELNFANANATDEELNFFEKEGEWPEESPGWLDNWLTEDGDFVGVKGFYNEYPEEGRMYWDHFKSNNDGALQTSNTWNGVETPDRILLAWADYERPPVPGTIPEQSQAA